MGCLMCRCACPPQARRPVVRGSARATPTSSRAMRVEMSAPATPACARRRATSARRGGGECLRERERVRECHSGGCTALVCAGRLTDPRAPFRTRRRCGSCANVYSKAYRAAGLRVSTAPMGAPLKQAPAAAVASLDLPRSRQGLQRYYQLVASTTGDLWCARRPTPLAPLRWPRS